MVISPFVSLKLKITHWNLEIPFEWDALDSLVLIFMLGPYLKIKLAAQHMQVEHCCNFSDQYDLILCSGETSNQSRLR